MKPQFGHLPEYDPVATAGPTLHGVVVKKDSSA